MKHRANTAFYPLGSHTDIYCTNIQPQWLWITSTPYHGSVAQKGCSTKNREKGEKRWLRNEGGGSVCVCVHACTEGGLTPSTDLKALQCFTYTAQCYHSDQAQFWGLTHEAVPACVHVCYCDLSMCMYTSQYTQTRKCSNHHQAIQGFCVNILVCRFTTTHL